METGQKITFGYLCLSAVYLFFEMAEHCTSIGMSLLMSQWLCSATFYHQYSGYTVSRNKRKRALNFKWLRRGRFWDC